MANPYGNSRKRIIIFGGTFDPFTEAHYQIVKKICEVFNPWFMLLAPTVTDWYRKDSGKWLSDAQRSQCIEAAIRKLQNDNYSGVLSWNNDIYRKNSMPESFREKFVKNWHFIDTLLDIIGEYGNGYEYSFVIGSDQLEFFKKWYRWEDILNLANMIVVNGRNGKTVESDIPHEDITIPDEYINVSATEVRKQYGTMKNGFEEYLRMFSVPEKETVIKQTPIFTLVRKAAPYVDQPDFHPVGINSPDWVTVIARFKDKNGGCKYITVRQLRYGPMKEFDEFPCGMVEKDECPAEAAARELREETGWIVAPDKLVYLGAHSPNPAFMNNLMYYYFIDLDEVHAYLGQTDRDEHERISIGEMSLKELDKSFRDNKGSALIGCALHLMKNIIKEEEK